MTQIGDIFLHKLNLAFETITQPDGTPYTPEDVMVETRQGISGSYLRRLRSGHISNPTIQIVGELSRFFQVPPSYFLEAKAEIPAPTERQIEEITGLLTTLSTKELAVVKKQIELIQSLRS